MIDLHNGYAGQLNDLSTWHPDFPVFAAHVKVKGLSLLFDNTITIGFVDGHFQHVSRPGGPQNVLHSVGQQDLYSGYYKTHWLKYLCVIVSRSWTC